MINKKSEEEIKKFVLKFISKLSSVEVSKLDLSDSLEDKLGLDSLDKIDLVLTIEDELDVCFQEDDEKHLKTIEDVLNTSYRLSNYEEIRCKLSTAV